MPHRANPRVGPPTIHERARELAQQGSIPQLLRAAQGYSVRETAEAVAKLAVSAGTLVALTGLALVIEIGAMIERGSTR